MIYYMTKLCVHKTSYTTAYMLQNIRVYSKKTPKIIKNYQNYQTLLYKNTLNQYNKAML